MIFGHQADNQTGVSDGQQAAGSPPGSSFIVGAQQDASAQSDVPDLSSLAADDPNDSQSTSVLTDQTDAPSLSDESTYPQTNTAVEAEVDSEEPQADTAPEADAVDTADESVSAPVDEDTVDGESTAPSADLLVLKQQALSDLGPLVSQLDQTPEERFRTTMMMLQSTDNQALIKDAYAAAQEITDEKVRAQALLDVVNEINYFTQQSAKK